MKELISIGLPIRNESKYVAKTIQTLLNQAYINIELIISDDASTDKTAQICKEFSKKDKRIKYFRQEKKLGEANNFNFVLKKAKGKYFLWSSGDDYWHKNFLKITCQLLEKNKDAVLAVSNFDDVYQNKHYHHHPVNSKKIRTKFQSILYFLKKGELSYFYGLYKTKVLKKIKGYHIDSRPFFKSSDYLTILKILLENRMVYAKKVLFFKQDTGYHFARFEVMKNLQFNKKTIKVILRFLCFPLFFIYNLFYSIKYISFSDFKLIQKIMLLFYALVFFFKSNFVFLCNLFFGFFNLLIGIFFKLRKR